MPVASLKESDIDHDLRSFGLSTSYGRCRKSRSKWNQAGALFDRARRHL